MDWKKKDFEIKNIFEDTYFFAGTNWETQKAKRFILKVKRIGKLIESSYYQHIDCKGKVVSVAFEPSTSYGCPIKCLFCASGSLTPIIFLSKEEIKNQLLFLIKDFNKNNPEQTRSRKDIFYTGIGEPTLIPDEIIDVSSDLYKKYPELNFKLSTVMANPEAIIKFARSGLPIGSLQIGFPHWDEKKLKYLFGGSESYNLKKILDKIKEFSELRPKTKVKFNYVGIKGFNDSEEDLKKTIKLLKDNFKDNFELKISCLNPTEISRKNNLYPMNQEELEKFVDIAKNLDVTVYLFGPMNPKKIGCGQLVGNYNC